MIKQDKIPGPYILLSFIGAVVLTVLPLPPLFAWFRPEWVAMVLIYWVIRDPERIGVGFAWLIGLFIDVLRGVFLGQYALVFAVMAYFITKLYKRLRLFPIWQQAITVLILIGGGQIMVVWIRALGNQPTVNAYFWLPAITSMLCWPLMSMLLNRYIYKLKTKS